ncbi:MAG: hypothetical protein K0R99_940 [Microbacterium sp.]|jgi:hypothetical protein|uniref:hypothetical protein n=1 Tax=Microbacterium sp. TaxID=51671 RepID=UPI0026284838|nr:hypothetical protein [Microbacterium sp.]MDF2559494.1 hypothetical protein [Microbacterium sp.]
MSKFAEFTELPTPGYIVKEKGRTYLNDDAVKAAKKKAGAWIELAEGHLMDKAYFGTLEGQAAKIDNRLEVAFVPEKRERNKNTPSGIPSYSYKGRVFLRYIDAVTEAQSAELERKRKAKEAKKRAKRAERELAELEMSEQAAA